MQWYALAAFGGQFLFVFLMGMQVANIRDRNYAAAFIVSVCISASELFAITVVIRTVVAEHPSPLVYAAFALGGACGIVASMQVSDFIERVWERFAHKGGNSGTETS